MFIPKHTSQRYSYRLETCCQCNQKSVSKISMVIISHKKCMFLDFEH